MREATDEQLISGWKAKQERNSEIAREKTAEEVKTLLSKEPLPQSAFTPGEEAMMYYFMLSKLRSVKFFQSFRMSFHCLAYLYLRQIESFIPGNQYPCLTCPILRSKSEQPIKVFFL